MSKQAVMLRYSAAFKQKVVSEIESGRLTVQQARRLYDIRGGETIQRWLRSQDKSHLLSKVVRVQMKDELDRMKEQSRHIQQLENALAHAQLKILTLESTIEVIEEIYGPVKKKSVTKVSGAAYKSVQEGKRNP